MSENNEKSLPDVLLRTPRHVHLLGICGVGMVGLARLFISAGAHVTGSDQAVYPPMSLLIEEMGIKTSEGYSPDNLSPRPDLAIVGNVIRAQNPEAQALINERIPYTSYPGALRNYFLHDKVRIVVTGTHGKTTLTSMISWILFDQGLEPGFLVGGVPGNFGFSSRLGSGRFFVLEGDEYDTAYFDKNPKFLQYEPDVAVITSIEFDHADIYSDVEQIKGQFSKMVDMMSDGGTVIACSDYTSVLDIIHACKPEVQYYGSGHDPEWSLSELNDSDNGLFIKIQRHGQPLCQGMIPIFGVHNALNTLAAVATVSKLGISPDRALKSMESFKGVQRRQQVYELSNSMTLIDDFAHHPTAVKLTCEAVKSRFPGKRLISIFEPRTNTSRRSIFQKDYVTSFLSSDLVILRNAPFRNGDNESDMFDSEKLACDLRMAGKDACSFADAGEIFNHLMETVRADDVLLLMSNGNFEGLRSNLLNRLNGVKQ